MSVSKATSKAKPDIAVPSPSIRVLAQQALLAKLSEQSTPSCTCSSDPSTPQPFFLCFQLFWIDIFLPLKQLITRLLPMCSLRGSIILTSFALLLNFIFSPPFASDSEDLMRTVIHDGYNMHLARSYTIANRSSVPRPFLGQGCPPKPASITLAGGIQSGKT